MKLCMNLNDRNIHALLLRFLASTIFFTSLHEDRQLPLLVPTSEGFIGGDR